MNGRIYDPSITRFVQADPVVQDPLKSQSLNRYSYVWNNPLNSTDPSGYQRDCDDSGDSCDGENSLDHHSKNAESNKIVDSKPNDLKKEFVEIGLSANASNGDSLLERNDSNVEEELGYLEEQLTRVPPRLLSLESEKFVDEIQEEIVDTLDIDFFTPKNWRSVYALSGDLPDLGELLSGHKIVSGQTFKVGSPISLGVEIHVDFHDLDIHIEKYRLVHVVGVISTYATSLRWRDYDGTIHRIKGDKVVSDDTIRTPLEGMYYRYRTTTGLSSTTQKWPVPYLGRKIPLR